MKCIYVLLLLFFANCIPWALGKWSSNYCASGLCSGLPHIACRNNREYGPQCRPDSRLLDLTSVKEFIVDLHNRYRNRVAGGKLPRYSPAVRMATMQADDELEYIASLNVKRCTFEHDECRNTDRFRYSGQNLAYRWDPPGDVPNEKQIIAWALDYWFNEYVDTDMDQVDSFFSGRGAEHFMVMMAERNIACGCAALQQSEDGGVTTFVACNYATTNMIDQPIYRRGKPASLCRTGTNPKYPNLCSSNERINVNAFKWRK